MSGFWNDHVPAVRQMPGDLFAVLWRRHWVHVA
jgi:hypothetical protein